MKVKIIYDQEEREKYSLIETNDLELLVTIIMGFKDNDYGLGYDALVRVGDENDEEILVIENYNYYVE